MQIPPSDRGADRRDRDRPRSLFGKRDARAVDGDGAVDRAGAPRPRPSRRPPPRHRSRSTGGTSPPTRWASLLFQSIADAYTKDHPNVTIKITVLENEAFKAKLTATAPDGLSGPVPVVGGRRDGRPGSRPAS